VTQGARPIHIYNSLNTDEYGTLVPRTDITCLFDIMPDEHGVIALDNEYKEFGDFAEIIISPKESYSGFVYITIHLNYGLKKVAKNLEHNLMNDNAFNSDIESFSIENEYHYVFSVSLSGIEIDDHTIVNINIFKKDPGFAGVVTDCYENPKLGVQVEIIDPVGEILATVETDEDGFYFFYYKHTGKGAMYIVRLPDYDIEQEVYLKANRFVEVDLQI
jgi:hypothetical protein